MLFSYAKKNCERQKNNLLFVKKLIRKKMLREKIEANAKIIIGKKRKNNFAGGSKIIIEKNKRRTKLC